MSDKEIRKTAARKKLEKTHMIGNSKVDKLKTHMGGKRAQGFTEKRTTHMVGKGSTDKIIKTNRSLTAGNDFAARALARTERTAVASAAKRGGRVFKKVAQHVGKFASKLPMVGALAGPAVVLATGGTPGEAFASAVDSEDLGAGSDQVGDQSLSRAERLRAERRVIKSRKKR